MVELLGEKTCLVLELSIKHSCVPPVPFYRKTRWFVENLPWLDFEQSWRVTPLIALHLSFCYLFC